MNQSQERGSINEKIVVSFNFEKYNRHGFR